MLTYAFRGAGTIDVTAGRRRRALGFHRSLHFSRYSAGIYDVIGYVSKGSDRYTVFQPDRNSRGPATAGSSYDGRSHVRRSIPSSGSRNRATRNPEIDIEGVEIERISHEELLRFRSKYLQWYQQEQAAERLKQGTGSGRTILTRFGK